MFTRWTHLINDSDFNALAYTPPSTCSSVLISDLAIYGSAQMPEADGVTVGGAVDTAKRIDMSDVNPAGTLDAVSSVSGDSATIVKYGVRDATGAEVVITQPLTSGNATTPAVGSQTAQRLLYGLVSGAGANGPTTPPSGTAATGDVALFAHTRVALGGARVSGTAQSGANPTSSAPALLQLQAGDGAFVAVGNIVRIINNTPAGAQFQLRRIIAVTGFGTDFVALNQQWTTIPASGTSYEILQGMLFEHTPNAVTCITRLFTRSFAAVSGGATTIFYEKVFFVNNNTGIALTQAQVQVAGESPTLPTGDAIDMALCNALNDGGTVTNRQTAPASGIGAFVTQPAFINVPAPGNLPSGSAPNTGGAQGAWLRLTLQAGSAAWSGGISLQAQGVTT